MEELHGANVIKSLAEKYIQLYIAPGEGASQKYLQFLISGQVSEKSDLSHFLTSEDDSISYEETPAGKIAVISFGMREDFETFIRIMSKKCEMVDIPKTLGSTLLDGKTNSLIVLSSGPYSTITGSRFKIQNDEWLMLSKQIRKYHECTHFVCRRLFPDMIDTVWDELVADAVGIYGTFGYFDEDMEKAFLGIEHEEFIGGRLENYTDIDEKLLKRISDVLSKFSEMISENSFKTPYDLAIHLEKTKQSIWNN